MLTEYEYLRSSRKKTDITQSDMGFLMQLSDCSNISRCENGDRRASLDMLLVYHLLFDIPLLPLFEVRKDNLIEDLIVRVTDLLQQLRREKETPKIKGRIAFLTEALTRLTA